MLYAIFSLCLVAKYVPLIYHNHKRKSIAGLSFDLIFWTSLSALLRAIHVLLLRYNATTREQYALRFPLTPVPDETFVTAKGFPPASPPGASLTELAILLGTVILMGGYCGLYQTRKLYWRSRTEAQSISGITLIFLVIAFFLLPCSLYFMWGSHLNSARLCVLPLHRRRSRGLVPIYSTNLSQFYVPKYGGFEYMVPCR